MTEDFTTALLEAHHDGVVVPASLAGRPIASQTRHLLTIDGSAVVVGVANDLVQTRMVQRTSAALEQLREIPETAWWPIFPRAADLVEEWLRAGRLEPLLAAASATSGLPVGRLVKGLRRVVEILRTIRRTLAAQAPGGDVRAYATGITNYSWALLPAGRNCLVRVPDNFPTIAVEWFQVIAARRPVIVNTSDGDVVLSAILVAALYRSGIPPEALALVHGSAATAYRLADQLIWPGEDVPAGAQTRAKTYHFGRSKALLASGILTDDVAERVTRLAFEGCGRLCTNVSSLVVLGGIVEAEAAASVLARHFSAIRSHDGWHSDSRVAAWADRDIATTLVSMIKREVAAGARDITAEVTGLPLIIETDGVVILRPTVLLTNVGSPLFGTELPFPFTAVAPIGADGLIPACANSLIVSVLPTGDADSELLSRILLEPTITKVFAGADFDRGYVPEDPQEGYLIDYLFQKKGIAGWALPPNRKEAHEPTTLA